MKRAAILAVSTALGLALAGPSLAAPAKAASAAPAAAWKAPRNAMGQPDLAGNWTNATLTPLIRNPKYGAQLVMPPDAVKAEESEMARQFAEGNKPTDPNAGVQQGVEKNVRPEFAAAGGDVGGYNIGWLDPGSQVMRVGGEPRTSLITTSDGRPPKRRDGAPAPAGFRNGLGSFDSYETRSLGERCILGFGRNAGPPMFPNGFYNNNYQIVQTPTYVAIDVEMVHDIRIVRLNAQHRTDGVRPWMGDSVGHYEGDTLVVETTNIPEQQNFFGSWKNLKVTERFTRVAPNRLLYQFTIDDPSLWEKPWGGEYEFSTLKGELYEYACHEGNYALPGMLAGARNQEKEAAEAAAKAAAPPAAAPSKGKKGA
ncbi:hypothetical protein [Phenylobacterium soli]|uniref:Uncharacterized protein n=1 Tax=Phenylobacterium soli TaxID=2170551 RepID=A0A328AHD8_9CAUL|nr:hypothetical protein [Phenylobacterium soli]RAK53506.1 hypothetical protein DJ017_02675 [Phenylobacterium soli]